MTALSEYADIVYFENAETRRLRISRRAVSESITVVDGLIPIWNKFRKRGVEWFVWPLIRMSTNSLLRNRQSILLWSAENCLRPYRFFRHNTFVFDCIDPCFSENAVDLRDFQKREEQNRAAADLIFASSESLRIESSRSGKPTFLLNNAAPPAAWQGKVQHRKPAWWPDNKSVVAYLGTLDRRLDLDYVLESARRNENFSHVLAGTIAIPESELDEIRSCPNVVIPGRVSDEEGEYIIANCSCGIIPFRCGAMNDAVNPVKLYYYAMHGRQVVGTRVAEVVLRPEVASAADSPGHFAELVRAGVAGVNDSRLITARRQFACENTWTQRADYAWHALKKQNLIKDE